MLNFKTMGSAVIVILTMFAISASGASAASYKSETGATTYVTAVQEGSHTFTGGAKVVCTGTTASGEFTSGATSLTLTNIAYTGCTIAGQAATATLNGCDYKLGEPTGAASPYTIKTVTIECPAGNQIVFTATTAGCTIKLAPQITTGTSTGTNNAGPPKTITFNGSITGIAYTGSGGICGGSAATGTTSGKLKISGFTSAAHTTATGIFIG